MNFNIEIYVTISGKKPFSIWFESLKDFKMKEN